MSNPVVSVLIPSRNERFLSHTIKDLIAKSAGAIEIISTLDGYWPPAEEIISDKRVHYIHNGQPQGMRPGINAAAAIAKGRYLMKVDAHCMFDEGWDVKLAANCDDDWVSVPRRKRLDAENWCIQDAHKPDIDYMYVSYPDNPGDWGGPGLNGRVWDDKNRDASLKSILIDDLMSAQGSCWFMPKKWFEYLELMNSATYGTFWNEFQEIGFQSWLSGGRVIVNKNTWYAHLHKGRKYGRGYHLDEKTLVQGRNQTIKWLTNSAWHKQTLPLSWLIDKFWPIPGWPENYREELGPQFSIVPNVARSITADCNAQLIEVARKPGASLKPKAYVDTSIESRGVQRVAKALRDYSCDSVEVVGSAKQADLVILHVIGRQDRVRAQVEKLKSEGKRYAIIQYCIRSTLRPSTKGWLPIWQGADLVWSYLDLARLCAEDGYEADFNLYYSPLGVDNSLFYPHIGDRYLAIATSGLSYLTESVKECHQAAVSFDKQIAHIGPKVHPDVWNITDVDDIQLAAVYSLCQYVSGLRRVEGFELPAAEGLLCGARPILFDRPHYREWFEPWAIFIPEEPREKVVESLKQVFRSPYNPVSKSEIEEARKRFDWQSIVKGFWEALNEGA